MSELTLVYFDSRGRAELSRLILTQAGKSFNDNRISFQDWPSRKPKAPLGQMPYLEIDDLPPLPQSLSIARYLARENNLVGNTSIEQAQADAVVDTINDAFSVFIPKIIVPIVRDDAEAKAEGIKSFLEQDLTKHYQNIEKLIQIYGRNGYSVGENLTWADLAIYDFNSKMVETFGAEAVQQFSCVQNVAKNVEEQPKIAEYIKNRSAALF